MKKEMDSMVKTIEIGEQLKAGRKKIGLTLEEVGSYIDYSPSYINLLENNKRKSPGIDVLSALADLYKLDMETLRGKNNEKDNDDLPDEVKVDIKEEINASLEQLTDVKTKLDDVVFLLEDDDESDLKRHIIKETKCINNKIKALQKSLSYSLYQAMK